MKPNFALRLAHDSIELLQRSPDGWLTVGSAELDDADLDASLARLREHAERLAPEGVTTKLIIPDTELRYETVLAPGPDDVSRRRQIEAAVDGLTPYGLDELVLDWVVEGDHALVVVAARETLDEAEEFAAQHGLNPVSFVGLPARGQFLGEPFFGATRHSVTALPAGTRVLADLEPVKVVGRARVPAAKTLPAAPTPEATATGAAPPAADAAPSAEAITKTPKADAPKPPRREATPMDAPPPPVERAAEAPAPEDPAPTPAENSGTTAPLADPRKRPDAPSARRSAASTAAALPGLLPTGLRRPGKLPGATGAQAASAIGGVGGLMRRLGKRLQRPGPLVDPRKSLKSRGTAPAESPDEAVVKAPDEASPAAAAAPSFASRRKPEVVAGAPGQSAAGGRIARPGKPPPPGATTRARQAASRFGDAVRQRLRPSGTRAPSLSADSDKAGDVATKATAASAVAAGAATKAAAMSGPGPAPKAHAEAPKRSDARAFDRAPPKPPAPVEPIVAKSRPPSSEAEKAREAQALTIFGARSAGAARGDTARRGLVVGGGLLLLLIAFAVWVAYFAADRETLFATPPATEATDPPATAAVPAEPETTPPPIAEAEQAVPAPAEELAVEETAAEGTVAETAPVEETAADSPAEPVELFGSDARLEALVEEALRQGEPAEQFADPEAAGLAELSEPVEGAPSEVLSQPTERLALPGPLQRPAFELPTMINLPPPPPFGTEMQLGEDGLIVATPEGAMTPQGVTVFARPPGAVPPTRPQIVPPEAAPAAETPVEDDASASGAVAPAESEEARLPSFNLELEPAPGADPALAGFRPLARPQAAAADPEPVETAAGTAAAEAAEETVAETAAAVPVPAAEATPGGLVLAALRPNPRPESLIDRPALATPEATEAAELDLASATPQAVARSLAPNARPQDFSATVQRALAAAARNQQPQAAQTRQAAEPQQPAPPPQQQAQPQTQTRTAALQPQIPSSASVAETATERRAINLRRVNLIGVFGAQSNRRALVRMPNGQVVRVQVGDTLDGGRVSAIGDTELRYVRGGRNQVLRIGQSG